MHTCRHSLIHRTKGGARKIKNTRRKKKGKKGKGKKGEKESPIVEDKHAHDDVIDYPFIAEEFPDIPLGLVLMAEKQFLIADSDGNGEIDLKGVFPSLFPHLLLVFATVVTDDHSQSWTNTWHRSNCPSARSKSQRFWRILTKTTIK